MGLAHPTEQGDRLVRLRAGDERVGQPDQARRGQRRGHLHGEADEAITIVSPQGVT